MRRCPSKIPLECIVTNGFLEDPCSGGGVVFLVCFVGFDKRIGGIIGLVDLGLDVGGLFEGLASFSA